MHGVGCWTKAHIFRLKVCRKILPNCSSLFSDRKPIYLYQGSLISPFSLKILQDILPHPDTLPVNQVEFILLGF